MITAKLEGSEIAIKGFKTILDVVNDRRKIKTQVIHPAAKIVKKVMIGLAPKFNGTSFDVYRTPKASGSMRAPNGMGKIYVSIKPGQLKNSIKAFTTRRSSKSGAMYIGPRYKSGTWKKPEKGGWYMHMVQFGTQFVKPQPFVKQALLATKKGISNLMEKSYKKLLAEGANKTLGVFEVK
jgi:HK97 gp10 family phage protein